MQRVLINLLGHLELDRELGRESNPAGHHAHHALFGVAIILDVNNALADAVNALESSPVVKCHSQLLDSNRAASASRGGSTRSIGGPEKAAFDDRRNLAPVCFLVGPLQ